MKTLAFTVLMLMVLAFAPIAKAQTKMIGGASMYPTKNIVENAVNSKDHTTLVAAIRAAGLVEGLEGAGPFTVFAPTNEAFNKLPTGTIDKLLKPENKNLLTKILNYHIVIGLLPTSDLWVMLRSGNGKAVLNTVEGGVLTLMSKGKKLYLIDQKGGVGYITIADIFQSNGVIHVVNAVLMPE
ncbi:fasciclin domain-containing protein [Mucilaginibacter sp. SP1R1]|uniref:fasciclin domain-containing protein n=1 Tax=Mucilaginibacter sp. SP1R1 TaxID=2723091 RepID=UPI00160DA100|nr:fasciclin domain-containing protein [Mucilaginibacter sp. SP1R1]MBB6148506.1 putative surface protein with fasciclin (FAS1) repeats [Mucilaginibacter sp. SP1R1]